MHERCFLKLVHNVFGLGAVACLLVRWENCAKPVLCAAFFCHPKKYFLKKFAQLKYFT